MDITQTTIMKTSYLNISTKLDESATEEIIRDEPDSRILERDKIENGNVANSKSESLLFSERDPKLEKAEIKFENVYKNSANIICPGLSLALLAFLGY